MGTNRTTNVVVASALLALLAFGIVGAALHHGENAASTAAAAAPASAAPSGRHHIRVPSGFKVVPDPSDGVTIDVPAAWRTPALASGSYADALRAFARDNPEFAAIVQQRLASTATPIGLFAVEPRSHATVVIQSAPIAGGTKVDAAGLPTGLRDRYTELGIALVGTDTVQLPLGKALRAQLRFLSGGQELVANQYFVADGSKLVTVTIQGPAAAADAAPDDRIARTTDRIG
ncbi:MAG: hypothetical protein M3N98_07635 [Actinomycetota bacterium]|nr:hypothetical protein [Actinomycetota bacterium]